ncbi:MAG TPA: ABC transporter ATP-binding protein [Candidatus Scatomonas pullistercoris]|uniref:ABC transporter ATP-binding protein n=1 Tax=Candidatus Scatomonas pullistercoris TaxID=2840920 RepID=A0A9D1TA70_9FIRM|nr:ABC transporter ATP-binding protein [Candidatus Scatomonas pullistercoris]
MELLKLEHIFLSYHTPGGETPALQDVSFSLEQGEFAAIVGPSGCGKSTILNLIDRLLPPESGNIFIEGKPLADSHLNIGYMLQKDHLFEWRTIYSNVLLGLEIQHKLTPENRARVEDMLEAYGLAPFRNARPSELSGGMRQRAALIRTLALDPALLLLDEPFSALDYQTRLHVADDIGQIIRRERKTALLVTHDISEAISMADRVIILSPRPARVRRIVPVSLSIPERTPMRSREAPEFKTYFNLIWKELNSHEGD